MWGLGDGDAHRARGAFNDALRSLDARRIEVLHLGLGDLAQLRLGDLPDLRLVRRRGAFSYPCGLLEQVGGGRCLGDKGERAVLVDGDLYWDNASRLVGSALVVLLA